MRITRVPAHVWFLKNRCARAARGAALPQQGRPPIRRKRTPNPKPEGRMGSSRVSLPEGGLPAAGRALFAEHGAVLAGDGVDVGRLVAALVGRVAGVRGRLAPRAALLAVRRARRAGARRLVVHHCLQPLVVVGQQHLVLLAVHPRLLLHRLQRRLRCAERVLCPPLGIHRLVEVVLQQAQLRLQLRHAGARSARLLGCADLGALLRLHGGEDVVHHLTLFLNFLNVCRVGLRQLLPQAPHSLLRLLRRAAQRVQLLLGLSVLLLQQLKLLL
mmetsp:Transcript_13420/g.34827  ORF Transcript_13420/g.34827 Transcript_13420/m.34827 type:complete len:272 (-) Transcript_13420:580-1395(-)